MLSLTYFDFISRSIKYNKIIPIILNRKKYCQPLFMIGDSIGLTSYPNPLEMNLNVKKVSIDCRNIVWRNNN